MLKFLFFYSLNYQKYGFQNNSGNRKIQIFILEGLMLEYSQLLCNKIIERQQPKRIIMLFQICDSYFDSQCPYDILNYFQILVEFRQRQISQKQLFLSIRIKCIRSILQYARQNLIPIIYKAQMPLIHNNPFDRPNPFKINKFKQFHHPHLGKNLRDYSHLIYHDSNNVKHSRLTINNWKFNDNNLSKKVDFNQNYSLNNSHISDFQKLMRGSSIYSNQNYQTKIFDYKQGKLQNPFYRKNLLVDKNAVENQLEVDLSIYRNKANSTFCQSAERVSFGTQKMMEESPTTQSKYSNDQRRYSDRLVVQESKINEVQIQFPCPLNYSKTPQMSQLGSNNVEQFPPKTIELRNKTFYLIIPKSSRL